MIAAVSTPPPPAHLARRRLCGTMLKALNPVDLVIANAGHWLMEEQPEVTVRAIRDFLGRNR